MRKILLTGATGTMGLATLQEFISRDIDSRLILFARKSKKNINLLSPYQDMGNIEIIWGDLTSALDITRAVADCDIVLHVGGLVSPDADRIPLKTWEVNTKSMRLIIDAVKKQKDSDNVAVVYIGSVSQYGSRRVPHHWGRTGDPMVVAVDDYYALSKITAERILSESGLKRWVSLRQTAILSPSLLRKGSDPISFHVALKGALEWTTAEDSARLLVNLCEACLPESFWRRFYNIGNGGKFRMSNYDFECRLLKALGLPPPEKVFSPGWFASRNFHGIWFEDSDLLEERLHFRSDTNPDDYFRTMSGKLPFYFKLARLVPSFIIKAAMKRIASDKTFGPLYWKKSGCRDKMSAFFYPGEESLGPSSWDEFDRSPLPSETNRLDHGYDEVKPESELDLTDMRNAAEFRGGKCLSTLMSAGDMHTPLEWECGKGHRFKSTPATILLGGHWCPECMPPDWDYDREAKINPFLAQAWLATHSPEEHNYYEGLKIPDRP